MGGSTIPSLEEMLSKLLATKGSDLHLKVGSPPVFRIDGALHLSNLPKLQPEDTERIADEIVPERMHEEFAATNEADFAIGYQRLGRFRVNCYRQRGSVSIVLRAVSPASKNFHELGLPSVMEKLAMEPRGLILVTGPTGSGKTTTLGAVVDYINANRRLNIITLEDPIEILHGDKFSIVSQREVGVDTQTFAEAMRRVLRQDPDVILVGEMRDAATVDAAMKAAETGHLVLSTLHTVDATETINRIIDFFPHDEQQQARLVLAGTLRGIVSQRLLQSANGEGRVPAIEVMINSERMFDRIVDPRQTATIVEVMEEGSYYGMQTFDQALLNLYQAGAVTYQDAMAHTSSPGDFKLKVQNLGLMSA